jgi:hypothetical protein
MSNRLSDLLKDTFGVTTMTREPAANIAVGVAVGRVLEYNDNRLGLTFINQGATTLYLSTKKGIAVGDGYRLLAAGGSISFSWQEDFDLVAQEWYGISSAAGGVLSYVEVVTYGTSGGKKNA